MRTENRSTRHPTKRLQPLIDFVARRTECADRTTFRFLDAKDPERITGGYSWQVNPNERERDQAAPSLVKLQLSRGAQYPRQTMHVAEVGPIVLQSWEEEVLLVLAHEMRHVDQFWTQSFSDKHLAEVDAEAFALRVLQQFRRNRRTC